jgi:oligopeptide/dipeptide ABC transporter ATP-binding protein
MNPKLIVCDEPVSALDVSIQAQILNLMRHLQKDYKLSYIFIAHDLSVVQYMSDRIAVMYLGKIVESANTDELFANPQHPYTRALLSAIPVPNPELKRDRIILEGDVPSPINPPSGCRFNTRCPLVEEQCRRSVPEFVALSATHSCACHVVAGKWMSQTASGQ